MVVKGIPIQPTVDEVTERQTRIELMFRLADKDKDREYAKSWIDAIKARGMWTQERLPVRG